MTSSLSVTFDSVCWVPSHFSCPRGLFDTWSQNFYPVLITLTCLPFKVFIPVETVSNNSFCLSLDKGSQLRLHHSTLPSGLGGKEWRPEGAGAIRTTAKHWDLLETLCVGTEQRHFSPSDVDQAAQINPCSNSNDSFCSNIKFTANLSIEGN